MARAITLVCLLAVISLVAADVYMHNPRGSNNRYRGDTNNQNRAFNSQNNNNGGYGWGPEMTYYEGSLLQIEWTAQHGCGAGHPNTDCEVILQYLCGPWVRDGTNDNTPPDNDDDNRNFVQHEPPAFWRDCDIRERNKGLFIADQNIGNEATETRQNDGGRRGWECNEERDYYPYWHPTPWRDIAILTSGAITTRCPYYYANSQNKIAKGHCISGPAKAYDLNKPETIPLIWGNGTLQNNQKDCISPTNPERNWVEVPGWNLPDPECISHPLTRDNHLGNSDFGAATARYLWALPTPVWDDSTVADDVKRATCVFRLRYNISSGDYNPWAHIDDPKNGVMINKDFNGKESPVRGNPKVTFGFDSDNQMRNLTLALNTDQYGRTFEDRSHSFWIKPRPLGVAGAARIFNLNVRGRRGNIVQTYPAVEYDFVPTNLRVARGDYVHFQWTGSDTQNNGLAGEGTEGTDRSNIVQLKNNERRTNLLQSFDKIETDSLLTPEVSFTLAHLEQPAVCATFTDVGCCLTYAQLEEKFPNNNGQQNQDVQNCAKLNAANAYFDGGLVQMGRTGTMNYMSSRNNNFTNRSQKASITVNDKLPPGALTVVVVGVAAFAGAAVLGLGVVASKFSPACANIFSGVKI
jgi:hypothetical protein